MKKSNLKLVALATLAITQQATAFEQEEILFQFDFATASANHSLSHNVLGNDWGNIAALNGNNPSGLNLAYSLTDNNNIEVLADAPLLHDANFDESNPLSTGNQSAEMTHLSTTLTANSFNNAPSKLMSYIGDKISTSFFEEEPTPVSTFTELDGLTLTNSFGIAAQVGADYVLNDKWFINGSTRWIDMNKEASFKLSNAEAAPEIIDVAPWVYSMTLGFRF
jgi:outer membrane protein